MKKFAITLAFGAMILSSQADWLLWTVSEDDADDFLGDVDSIRIGYVSTGTVPEWGAGTVLSPNWSLDHSASTTENLGINESGDRALATMVDLSAISGDLSSYSFYVELLNENNEVIARTAKGDGAKYVQYSNLTDYIATSLDSVPDAVVWHGGTLEAVPEPSSMALLALGAGLVGLRRKLRKNKKDKKEKRA